AAAGISDDDPLEEAFEKLRECCEDEAVADLLGLAAGVLEQLEGERSGQEIAWAARELMEELAQVQPLVLMFEDIHWAEEPLLERTEGNPLFVEETIRMLAEAPDGDADRIPDTLQAIISARIDHLPQREKTLLQRASVIGRVFWRGSVEHLAPDLAEIDDILD